MSHGIWHDLIHGAAAAILVAGGAVLMLLAVRGRGRPPALPASRPSPARPATPSSTAVYVTLGAALAAAAGLIHLAAAPSHIDELGLAGWSFVGLAIAQGTWALAWAIQPSRTMALAGITGSLAVVAAWTLTRTIGLPIGPAAGVPEDAGAADLAATAFELLLAALLVVRIGRLGPIVDRTLRRVPSLPSLAAVPVLGTVALATTIAVVTALGHSHVPGGAHGHEPAVERADTGG